MNLLGRLPNPGKVRMYNFVQTRSYWHGANLRTKAQWIARGTNGLSQLDLKAAPQNLIASIFLDLDAKKVDNVLKYLGNTKQILRAITKQNTMFDVNDPLSHKEMCKYYSTEQIQELLEKIYSLANHLFKKGDSKKASLLLEDGIKIAAGQSNQIEIQLKRQYGLAQVSENKSLDAMEAYFYNLLNDAEKVPVSEIEKAALKSHQGLVAVLKAMEMSNFALLKSIDPYKKGPSIQFYESVAHAKLLFLEAGKFDPSNIAHKTNASVVDTMLFGMYTPDNHLHVDCSKTGTIKLLPSMIKAVELKMSSHDTEETDNKVIGESITHKVRKIRPINFLVFQKLIELRKEILKEEISQRQEKKLLLAAPAPQETVTLTPKKRSPKKQPV